MNVYYTAVLSVRRYFT